MGSAKWEARRSSHSALSLNGQKPEIDCQVLSLKSEVGSRKSEVGRPFSAFELRLYGELLPFHGRAGYDGSVHENEAKW